ncbi:Molybdate metabolism regulator [Shigella dysenteriae 1617]|uniref:Molybdate metabolism regulator n=1 Tax=Shigella dysenteriae 1617 TaxID=754093 RepID=A0A0A6ZUH2_SHIDY|nr:Molybdate metabolism regulator [Shigella dysenteriae 1617]
MAQLPREMALTFWLRINEKKHLFAGEDYFLSILGLDALFNARLTGLISVSELKNN